MLRQLAGQISAHYSSSKIRNIHLRLFRLDHGPYTVYTFSDQRGPITIPFGVAHIYMAYIGKYSPPPPRATSAEGQRSFSKAWRLKTWLRSPMTQERFSIIWLSSKQPQRENRQICPTWQMNLMVVTIISKEISVYSKNPISWQWANKSRKNSGTLPPLK